jgi:predicted nucleotidyltransferase
MPVRSLSSSVLKWPDIKAVEAALHDWVKQTAARRADVVHIGHFGSFARGDWGVGSDLDLVIVVKSSSQPFERRSANRDTTKLPVPADVLVYTEQERQSLSKDARFQHTLAREAVWLYERETEGLLA